MRNLRWMLVSLIVGSVFLAATAAPDLTFMSTQLRPIEEAEWVRSVLLPPFTEETGIPVIFIGAEEPEMADRVIAEFQAGRGTIDLIGDLHGNFLIYPEALEDLGAALTELRAMGDRTFSESFLALSMVDGVQAYIPWMQATYVVVVNKKALPYMPARMATEGLTYDVLLEWAKAIYEATGEAKLGFPNGPRGLHHRFLHGYLYPSFTGAQVKNFNTPEAVAMWEYMVELWEYVNPAAHTWDSMDTPLLTEEVWIAWDHGARVKTALVERPDDFLALPSPAGPAGRGVITVLAGLAIPNTSPDPEGAHKLIEYLTRPQTQVAILQGVGFFPVVEEATGVVPTGGLKILADAVTAQSAAPDLIISIIPGGLGVRVGEFKKIYDDTFAEIVLRGRPIEEVLKRQGALLEALYAETGAPLPVPDINIP